jgi:hypothetical protein
MKKYSETFINSANILKNAKIGFEFELYMKDLSYYKTLEILNQYLEPVKVHGFRRYHSDFKTDPDNFKIEPDLSLGSNGMEIITGPLEYFSAKHYLVKILKFIQEYGYTTEKCAIHFNISFIDDCEKNLNNLNVLKLVLLTDEDEIYRFYPTRKDNVYAKTVKKVIPFKEYDYNNVGIETIKNTLRLPDDKYYGINFLHINNSKENQRLEYRYIGGKDYEKNIGQIIYFLDKFILDVWNSISADFTNADINELERYLSWNISNFKNLSKYDNFIVHFPSISLQIDQNYGYHLVNAYFSKIFDKIFVLVDSTDSLKDCIINYVTAFQTMEIIDARIKSTQNIKDYDFINCVVTDGIFENCTFVNCEIQNCQIVKSKFNGSRVSKTKLLNCSVEASEITDCFFMNGYLNCDMIGGVFRSGKLGPYANISSETKVVTDNDNFFDTSFDDDNYDFKTDKGIIKAFKK